ncbi:Histidine kinase [Sphingomonas guangdongensis]|uniref:Histidine kinase n=1 Tax=Sphingomonas guangdongensis TaxID=1141890 RepID=A0A285QAM1_9SPHN|nr:Histidine kinase [Sphingomonas guangdongensis]
MQQAGQEERVARGIAAATVLLFWLAQFSLLTTQRFVFGAGDDWSYLPPRLLVTGVGIALSFAILAFHARTGGSLTRRLLLAVAAALVGAVLHSLANFAIFHLFLPEQNGAAATLSAYLLAVFQWFWTYSAMSGLLLAIVYSAEVRAFERRAAQAQRDAHAAHLRALRYQLNPHFMFNTLNSIASLIAARRVEPAERMVENLSDFLRAGLATDPNEDIPLAREIELQSLYLAIEAVRFPNRLVVAIDMPDAVRGALVPSLITQPLVENAVRHAVASSTAPVTLTIAAATAGDRLRLTVSDRGSNGRARGPVVPGTGVGLRNVAERLAARYGEDCGFTAGPHAAGGFAVSFAIPLERLA